MIWWEINQTHTMGRYVLHRFRHHHDLRASARPRRDRVPDRLVAETLAAGHRAAGDRRRRDRGAAGAASTSPVSKVTIFVISAVFMTLTGAVMAPRFGFINPNVAFSPLISFQVVIMALLGGLQRLWAPILGIIPLVIISEWLQIQYPFWFSVLLGLMFMVIVYFVPNGITGLSAGRLGTARPADDAATRCHRRRGDGLAWLSRPLRDTYRGCRVHIAAARHRRVRSRTPGSAWRAARPRRGVEPWRCSKCRV